MPVEIKLEHPRTDPYRHIYIYIWIFHNPNSPVNLSHSYHREDLIYKLKTFTGRCSEEMSVITTFIARQKHLQLMNAVSLHSRHLASRMDCKSWSSIYN